MARPARAVGFIATLPLLWLLVSRTLSTDRGIEFTDEGLYLLEAVEGRGTTALAFPYAWHTGPLLEAVGGNVAHFRTLGGVILVIVAISAAMTGFTAGAQVAQRDQERRSDQLFAAWVGLSAAISALLYYAGFVRTPSYNWLNLVGLLIAVTGLHLRLSMRDRSRAQDFTPEGIVAIGLFLAVPAKPTTPILFALVASPLLWRHLRFRRAVRSVMTIAALSMLLLLLAVLTRVWDPAFFSVFLRGASAPVLMPAQSLPGAVLGFIRTPIEALRTAPLVALGLMAILLRVTPRGRLRRGKGATLGALLLATSCALWFIADAIVVRVHGGWPSSGLSDLLLQGRATQPSNYYLVQARILIVVLASAVLLWLVLLSTGSSQRARPDLIRDWVPPVLSLLAAVLLFGPKESVLFGGEGTTRFVDPGVSGALFMLALSAALISTKRQGEARSEHMLLTASLVLLALAFGFGTGHYPFPQAALAAPLFVAAVGVCAGAATGYQRRLIVASTVFLMTVMTSTVLIDSHHRPYGTVSISQQTELVTLARTQLNLDQGTAAIVSSLQRDAESAGWQNGDLLLDLSRDWVPGLTWVLEGRPPATALLTIGGYGQRSVTRFEHSLDYVDPDEARKAWIFVSVNQGGEPHSGSAALLEPFLEHVSCFSLQHCFKSVWREPAETETGLELWRPIP